MTLISVNIIYYKKSYTKYAEAINNTSRRKNKKRKRKWKAY